MVSKTRMNSFVYALYNEVFRVLLSIMDSRVRGNDDLARFVFGFSYRERMILGGVHLKAVYALFAWGVIIACAQEPLQIPLTDQPISLFSGVKRIVRKSEQGFLIEASQKVLIRLGERSVRTESLWIDTEQQLIWSDSAMRLSAPEGSLQGEGFEYNYSNEGAGGWFNHAYLEIGPLRLWADRLEGNLQTFQTQNVRLTACDSENPHYLILADRVSLSNADRLFARNVRLQLGGKNFLSLPFLRTRLKQKRDELSLPFPVYNAQSGLGFRWGIELPMPPRIELQLENVTYLRDRPQFQTRVAYNLAGSALPPSAEDEQGRFLVNPLQNLRSDITSSDAMQTREPFSVISLNRSTGIPLLGRSERDLFVDRLWELGWGQQIEAGQGAGTLFLKAGRLQEHRQGAKLPARDRLSYQADWFQPLTPSNRPTRWYAHASGAGYLYQGSDHFGWLRAQIAFQWQPTPDRRVSLGYARGYRSGIALYLADDLITLQEAMLRFEDRVGNFRLGFLLRYDLNRRHLYDAQVELALRQHCLEPTLFWRKAPSDFQVGLSLVLER